MARVSENSPVVSYLKGQILLCSGLPGPTLQEKELLPVRNCLTGSGRPRSTNFFLGVGPGGEEGYVSFPTLRHTVEAESQRNQGE